MRVRYESQIEQTYDFSAHFLVSLKRRTNTYVRSPDPIWVAIDDFGLDFEVEKQVLYLLRNTEKF